MDYRMKHVKLIFEDGKWSGKVFDKNGELGVIDSGKHYFLMPITSTKNGIISRYGSDDISLFEGSMSIENIVTFNGDYVMRGEKIKKGDIRILAVDFDKNIAFSVINK